MTALAPVSFVPHGGGPLPLMDDPHHETLVDFLKSSVQNVEKPDAIILISAHWEEAQVNITSNQTPDLIYDYFGFEPEAYQIEYPAKGLENLAQNIQKTLQKCGIHSHLNKQRGFDHGVFVPLKLMYPEADVPVVQLSLLNTLDPQAHIELGEALAAFRQQNIMIIGSGFSFHNMQAFFGTQQNSTEKSIEFDDWLSATCTDENYNYETKKQRLIKWADAPQARFCHPREEHLLPLLVCFGAAFGTKEGSKCERTFSDKIFNVKVSGFVWT